jgi:hypothetical protein
MGFLRRHAGLFTFLVLAALPAGACSLNPQPLPPDNPGGDAGFINSPPPPRGTATGDAADLFGGDAGPTPSVDAGGANPPDADTDAAAPPATDGGADAPDAEPVDATTDAGGD